MIFLALYIVKMLYTGDNSMAEDSIVMLRPLFSRAIYASVSGIAPIGDSDTPQNPGF